MEVMKYSHLIAMGKPEFFAPAPDKELLLQMQNYKTTCLP